MASGETASVISGASLQHALLKKNKEYYLLTLHNNDFLSIYFILNKRFYFSSIHLKCYFRLDKHYSMVETQIMLL